MGGKLYIVPTPIGNLGDITLRALEILKQVDLILAEDTRKTGILLKQYQISKTLKSYHSFNEHSKLKSIVGLLQEGKNIALVSDAGTPLISDPGFLLVREAISKEITVQTLPGPTAFIPALINSGFAMDKFLFEGFLPHKKGRKTRLANLAQEKRTMIFYESPHRITKTLEQFSAFFGKSRRVSVSRELTKIHEETIRGTVEEVSGYFASRKIKGEIVIVVEGAE